MAVEVFRRTVGASAGVLYAHPTAAGTGLGGVVRKKRIKLVNNTASQGEYVVGASSAVTTANGARIHASAPRVVDFELEPGEELWGIAATTQNVDVIVTGS